MEARGASGEVVAKEHAEIITAGGWMIPVFVVAALVAGAAILISGAMTSGWLRISLVTFWALVAIIGVGSLKFAMWGKYVGFPWHFTP